MNENRKLASVRKIDRIEQITRKDGQTPKCELAVIGGWKAMVSKSDNFKEGDLVIFAEPDSVFPEKPEWEFLKGCQYTIKPRKYNNMTNSAGESVISQGLVLKLSVLPSGFVYNEGNDVTSALGITHRPEADVERSDEFTGKSVRKLTWVPFYDKMMRFKWFRKLSLPEKTKGGFPSEVSKTDEERIQNCARITDAETLWTATEKVDGQSGTFLLKKVGRTFFGKPKYEFIMCSRNHRVGKDSGTSYAAMAAKYNIEEALKKIIGSNQWVCIQGECAGPGIQKNRQGLSENHLFCFNLIYPTGRMDTVTAKNIAESVGLEWVPVLETGINLKGIDPESLLKAANGKSALNKDRMREGIVFRGETLNLSFKAVSPEYLVAHDA